MQLETEDLWNQYYKEIIHRMQDIVLWYDNQGGLVNWNSAAVQSLGYEGQELSKLTIQALFSSDLAFVDTSKSQYSKEWFVIPVYRKNRTCFMGNVQVFTIPNQHIYGICIIKDVQQVKDYESRITTLSNELAHANEVKNLFLANVTHELRTPLNGMQGLLAMIDTDGLSEKSKEDFVLLKDCCQSMEKIVNQVLDYTKMIAGKLQATKEAFYIQEWITPLVRINQNLAQYKGLNFEVTLDQNLPPILWGDKEWIGQVLSNLLSNAIKFTEQGSVRLEIVKKAETLSTVSVLFVVSDTGIGIKQEQMKYLFKSFSQADSTITRKYGGTGLGLALCKGIVEAMGGVLEVESTYARGSRFYFELILEKCESNKYAETINNQCSSVVESESINQGQQVSFSQERDNLENGREIDYLLSQISLCIEFGSWERAQFYSHQVKSLLKGMNSEFGKLAFRLELASRRKDSEKAKDLHKRLLVAFQSD